MYRSLLPCVALLTVAGCALPPERQALNPLPENGPPQPFIQLVGRARTQASVANEAFYVNNWVDLEEAAKGLEQTARALTKASDIPAGHKDKLPLEAGDLGQDAVVLRDAAKAKEVKQANEALQRIHLKVRELRP
jgi:hypothetical protein